MVDFKRDPKTGDLLIYKDGKKAGKMMTMGDEIKAETEKKDEKKKRALMAKIKALPNKPEAKKGR